MFLYFDDFGYRSLSYRNLCGAAHVELTPLHLFRFLKNHYLHWGGRVLCFCPAILLLQQPELFRLAEAGMINLYFAAAGKLSDCFLLQRELASDSICWFTAAAIYVFPAPLVLLELSRAGKEEERQPLPAAAAFFAAALQEQYAAAVLTVHVLLLWEETKKNRHVPREGLRSCLGALAGFLFLYLCPGSFERAMESLTAAGDRAGKIMGATVGITGVPGGLAAGILKNAYTAVRILGADTGRLWMAAFLSAAAMAGWSLCEWRGKTPKKQKTENTGTTERPEKAGKTEIRGKRKKVEYARTWIHAGETVLCTTCAVSMITGKRGLSQAVLRLAALAGRETDDGGMLMLTAAVLFMACHLTDRFMRAESAAFLRKLNAGAFAALAAGLIAPEFPIRVMLPFYLLLFPSVGYALGKGILRGKERKDGPLFRRWRVAAVPLLCWILLARMAAGNYWALFQGYRQNVPVIVHNMEVLKNAGEEPLVLLRHPDDRYGNIMPYRKGYEWVEQYLRACYRIPDEVPITWKKGPPCKAPFQCDFLPILAERSKETLY